MTEYAAHPAAELFPMMSDAELRELADDIKANGLMDRIVLHDGLILDGRNRYAACKLADVEPQFQNPDHPVISPVLYVISKNLHRRHLSTSQRAAIAAEMLPLLREEAHQRQGRRSDLTSLQICTNVDAEVTGRSAEIAAEAVQVSPRIVSRAESVRRENPEAFERVKRGELTVNAAAGEQEKRHRREKPKSSGTYEANTPRKRQVAEAQKRKMIDGLSLVNGVCRGLTDLDTAMTAAVCTPEEIETWATKAENHARDLRRFAARLRGMTNGQLESCADGAAAGR